MHSSETKDSNPKDALGIRKVPLHAVPVKPLLELGLAMMEGGRKYGTHNYRAIGVRASTYYDAAMRHLMAWWEGEDKDPDSGVAHIVKAIACLFVLRDSQHMMNCIDDRPIHYPGGVNMAKFNAAASGLLDKYADCAKPFIEATGRRMDAVIFDEFAEDAPKGPDSVVIKPEPFDVKALEYGEMRIYCSHPIRGSKGKDATEQDMKDNNRIAIAAGKHWQAVLSKAFGKEVEVYIPGEHDEFVMIAYHRGRLSEDQILDVDCQILDTCDLLLVLNEDCISGGMKVEIDYAIANGIPVLFAKGGN